MRIFWIACLLFFMLTGFSTVVPAEAESHNEDTQDLKGLDTTNLDIVISKDANATLQRTASHPGIMRGALAKLVKARLSLVGIEVASQSSYDKAKCNTSLVVKVALDHNANIYLKLSVKEKVSLIRDPDNVLLLTTWSLVQDPRSNENGPIENTVGVMMDVFVAEYLKANPDKKQ